MRANRRFIAAISGLSSAGHLVDRDGSQIVGAAVLDLSRHDLHGPQRMRTAIAITASRTGSISGPGQRLTSEQAGSARAYRVRPHALFRRENGCANVAGPTWNPRNIDGLLNRCRCGSRTLDMRTRRSGTFVTVDFRSRFRRYPIPM